MPASLLGAAYLTRYEAAAAGGLAIVAVAAVTYWRSDGTAAARRGEAIADALIVGMPFVAAFVLWAGASWLITGSPFEQFTSEYGVSAQIDAGLGYFGDSGLTDATLMVHQLFGYQPLLPALLVVGLAGALWRRDPRWISLLVVFGGVLAFIMFAGVTGRHGGWVRYYITIIPLTIALTTLLLAPVRRQVARRFNVGSALGLSLVVIVSVVGMFSTTRLLGDRDAGRSDLYVPGRYAVASSVADFIDAERPGVGTVLIDAFNGSPVIALSDNPRQFVITSDRDFQEVLEDPVAAGIEYLIVPPPDRLTALDALNRTYPDLYAAWCRLRDTGGGHLPGVRTHPLACVSDRGIMNPRRIARYAVVVLVAAAALAVTFVALASFGIDPDGVPVGPLAIGVALVAAWSRAPVLVRATAAGIAAAVLGRQVGDLVDLASQQIGQPPEFDVMVFWIEAQVAAAGQNFYDPTFAWEIARQVGASPNLQPELFFWYPPPTMLLFLPLGWVDLATGAIGIYVVMGLSAIGSAFLLWRLFLADGGLLGLLAAATVLLVVHPAASTVFYGQTNFLLLFFVLMFWYQLHRPLAGVWFILANMVKPAMLPLAIVLFLRPTRAQMATLFGFATGVVALTLLAIGVDTSLSYATENPTSLAPVWLYEQGVNQSLLAVALRATGDYFSFGGPLANYLYLNVAAVLLVVSGFVCLRRSTGPIASVALLVTVGLMVYPGTLEHYVLLMAGPMLATWSLRARLPGGASAAIGLVVIEAVLVGVADGQRSFAAMLLAWGTILIVALREPVMLRLRRLRRTWPPMRAATGSAQ